MPSKSTNARLRAARRAHQPHRQLFVPMSGKYTWEWGWCACSAAKPFSIWMSSGITKNSSVKILCDKWGKGSKSTKFHLVYIHNHHFFSFHKILVPHCIYHQCLVNISHYILIVYISSSSHGKYHHNITVQYHYHFIITAHLQVSSFTHLFIIHLLSHHC